MAQPPRSVALKPRRSLWLRQSSAQDIYNYTSEPKRSQKHPLQKDPQEQWGVGTRCRSGRVPLLGELSGGFNEEAAG
eukprot:CAMPEP_0174362606 /NCGR_PEP_ID=MMETSP0811_2-20130205/65195_1 /TAXON_ID=73025 ORGANISM="Eutreptiella gymnastica-like, Strain CCMP1594" /NCGR_SAMPLE_ID=MMETSP0811_2 /ASSEMBLY_ACC=CAM_ASM_000667 /LENGTH=76 /DNA_ID=CAMNT_0015500469 /DNA_START=143 /DNA_END=369 /DNA_ORIENTATION=+